ncbi:HAMP domain-containing sensor histidine kinase [Fodinicola acaciae]|uniref:HAMP domain-containing sensor histidine kinase n=1 Tax=Fodinicola acaciae TaxID=2681555 RepID=UPI001C9E8594|nr:HAMP domain-containing sensor histidine kinase [Fodinicola acaciae]
MTTYGPMARPSARKRLRPTLRLRLTMINGALLVAAGVIVLGLAWVIVNGGLTSTERAMPGTTVTVKQANGTEARMDVADWQAQQARSIETNLLLQGGLALLAVSVIGVAGGYLVTRRALRPLHVLTQAARGLSTDTLSERISHMGPDDEVSELAQTFDGMLDRLAKAFDSQRRFVANASHELRTPLAVMRTEIDVTLSDPDVSNEDLRRMGRVVRDASKRANDLIEALLLLARTEAQAGRRLNKEVPVDLAVGVPTTLNAVSREVRRLGLRVETTFAPAMVMGDPALLERLAGNLIENAVRYNLAGGRLQVRTGSDPANAWLVVANTGPEVDIAEVPQLFEPFRRGGVERTGTRGAGLGLSIVRAVVDAHNGMVKAVPLLNGGLEVTVTLPIARTPMPVAGRATVPG